MLRFFKKIYLKLIKIFRVFIFGKKERSKKKGRSLAAYFKKNKSDEDSKLKNSFNFYVPNKNGKKLTKKHDENFYNFSQRINKSLKREKFDQETKDFFRWFNNRKTNDSEEDLEKAWEEYKQRKERILDNEEEAFKKYHDSNDEKN